jgi:phosphoglycerol transferase MdoB-like AlkP superfamily enzyme
VSSSPSGNATRNPLIVDQSSILSQFPDYQKAYFLGGSANWAQIRATLRNNIRGIELYEEGAFDRPVVDVWGISDADLLLEANANLRARKGPFWGYIQTSGNHPPFTIPKHHADFEKLKPEPEALRRSGFVSAEEYNAVRLMDYALMKFFEAARQEAYFKDTVFVLFSDHGIPRGNPDPRFGDLTLAIHHVPFLIYAPGRVAPGRDHRVGSQLDILPTLASLLGRPVWTQTLGKDLLDPAFKDRAAAFTFTTFRRPPRLGLIQDGHYLNVEITGQGRLFKLEGASPDLAAQDPERAARMLHLAKGFHAWSHFLLSHNKPFQAPAP